MKRIIVPIDFSSYADSAFLTALKIAEKENSRIICVNVVNTGLDWKNLSADKKKQHQDILDAEAEAQDKLNTYVTDHKLGGIHVESVVGIGVPHEIILEVAHKHNADLIVLGAYGKEHSKEKFLGSNLQKVIRNAQCPVLAVKKAMNGNHLKKMAFASMFNEGSKTAFVKMKPFIKAFHTSVHFLFVNTPSAFVNSSEAQKKMDLYAKGLEDLVIHKQIYCHQETEKGIIEFAENNKIGFIGIASSNRTGKSSYQIGVTDTVLYRTDIPVLSVKFE